MKAFALLLAILLLTVSLNAGNVKPPKGLAGKAWASTFALYGTDDEGTTHFLCTIEPYEQIPGGYHLLSAGHCVQDTPEGIDFSVAEEIGGARTPVTLIKAYFGDYLDFSIFEMKTTKHYGVLELGTDGVRVGDKIISVNFAAALGKQISRGYISSRSLTYSEGVCDETCPGVFLTQIFGAGGSSGAAVLSEKTGKVIGVTVGEWQSNVGLAILPISSFVKFLAAPAQVHPR